MHRKEHIGRACGISETLSIVEQNTQRHNGGTVLLCRGYIEELANPEKPKKVVKSKKKADYNKKVEKKRGKAKRATDSIPVEEDAEVELKFKKKTILDDFVPEKGDSLGKIVSKFFVGGAYLAFIISALWIVDHYVQEYQADIMQHEIRELYTISSNKPTMRIPEMIKLPVGTLGVQDNPVTDVIEEVQEPEKELILLPTAESFLAINKDTVGYIRIPNTQCDSVVVQGTDNEYYLKHNFYNVAKQCGTLFVDCRATINTHHDTQNLIVYGHNQKDNTMFGDLDKFKDSSYWKSNPIIYFNTNYEECQYLIVAAFVTNELPEHDNDSIFDYWNYLNFGGEYSFDKWKKEVLERTYFTTGYEFTETDSYLTLSTCSVEWQPSRFVIIARKLHDDETAESISIDGWKRNENPKRPQIWYDLYAGGRKWEAEQ